MKKAKILLIALLVVCITLVAVACNPTETPDGPKDPVDGGTTPDTPDDPDPVPPAKYTVTWQSGSSYSFTNEQGEALPSSQEVDGGSTLKFKVVVPDETMGVTKVVAGDDTLTADANGVYSVTVNSDISVAALVERLALVSIAVTTAPSRVEYIAGETLDTAGMVVTATYNNNATSVLTQYEVRYATGNALAVGDTKVTIVSGTVSCELTGLSVREAQPFVNVAVTLSAVEGKPVLTVAGTLGDATSATLAIKNCGKHNAVYDGKNFTITVDLATVIAGATAGDWLDLQLYHSDSAYIDLTRSQATNYDEVVEYNDRKYYFADYKGMLKIVWADAQPFADVTATLESVGGVPTLTVKGTLVTATSATLVITGDLAAGGTGEIGRFNAVTSGEGGKDFTISVNLATALATAKEDKWLDLKLYYSESSYLDLYKEQATNYDANFISAGKKYLFASWGETPESPQALKVYWIGVPEYTAEAGVEIVGDKAIITVAGQGDVALAGTDSGIKAWYNADIAFTGSVDETGAFVYTYELDRTAQVATMWLHKYENGTKKGDLKGTVATGKETVEIGNRRITVVSDNGQLKVEVTEIISYSYTAQVGVEIVGDKAIITVTGQSDAIFAGTDSGIKAWYGEDIAFTGSVDETGAFVYTYELTADTAKVDTMWLHKYEDGSKKGDLKGTIAAGKESVVLGNKQITVVNNGQLTVVVTQVNA